MRISGLTLVAIACVATTGAREPVPRHNPGAQPAPETQLRMAAPDTLWSGCSYRGIDLHGKVQIVDAFPDIKVQLVDAFPDIRVKWVTAFPDDCGEWQEVDAFPDFKIQLVDAFPDVKVQVVDAFPGLTRGG
ncbi:hypothetical protein ACFL3S_12700 [Gemmatimonadota bacterium]